MGNVRLFGGVFGCGEVLWPGAVDLLAGNALGGKAVSWIKPRLTTHGQLLLATPTPPPLPLPPSSSLPDDHNGLAPLCPIMLFIAILLIIFCNHRHDNRNHHHNHHHLTTEKQ